MWTPKPDHPLRRLFAGLTEQTFMTTLGVADAPLIDYLSGMLSRFIHVDVIYRLRDGKGRRLEEVADMMLEAQALPPQGRTRREIYRHIGDVTLFWTGVYPEALDRLRSALRKDHFLDYCEQGKRSYYIASTFEEAPYRAEAPVLRRLSAEFELCAYGLSQVRREWERQREAGGGHLPPQLLS
jgi:chlorite dismutase